MGVAWPWQVRMVLSPISCVALNFLTAAALTFSLAYFPIRAWSSGVKEVVCLLACLPPFSFGCKALTSWLTSWSTLGDSCVWLAVGRVVAGWKYCVPTQTHALCSWFESCTYHVTNVLHFNLLRKFISAKQLIARSWNPLNSHLIDTRN